jgi:hypothetical protein
MYAAIRANPIPAHGVGTFDHFLGFASHNEKKQSWYWVSEVLRYQHMMHQVWHRNRLGWVTCTLGLGSLCQDLSVLRKVFAKVTLTTLGSSHYFNFLEHVSYVHFLFSNGNSIPEGNIQ